MPLKRLVIFPNVREGTIDEVVMLRSEESATSYLGLHQVPSTHFARRLEALAAAALPEPGLAHLRRAFTPESEVPDAFVARTPMDRNTAANLPACFLDFDQEWCVKNDLDLLTREEAIIDVTSASVRLVTGVAGSGKSLVLLYRALLSAKLHPDARVLVLTHNKPLRYELERRSHFLAELPANLTCSTIFQWAASCLGSWDERMWWPNDADRALRLSLEKQFGSGRIHDAKSGPVPPAAFCTVTTLNAATGLEAPVVILLGMSHLLGAQDDIRLADDERRELCRDHTRKLYMGFTRAGQRLVVLRSVR